MTDAGIVKLENGDEWKRWYYHIIHVHHSPHGYRSLYNVKLNIKATDDMIFDHLFHLDINTRKLLIQFDRRLLPCTDACEG